MFFFLFQQVKRDLQPFFQHCHLYSLKWDQRLTDIIPPSSELYLVSSTEWQEESVFYPMLCHCFPHPALWCLIVLLWVTELHLRPCVKYWQIKAQRPFTQQRDVTCEAVILVPPSTVWQDLKYITYLRKRQHAIFLETLFSAKCADKLLFKYKSRNKSMPAFYVTQPVPYLISA